jgi:PAS domain-containing protein
MNKNPDRFFKSPSGMMIKVILVVLTGEFAIMLAIDGVLQPRYDEIAPLFFWEFLDAFLLASIVSPVLYFTALRPMNAQARFIEEQKERLSAIFNTMSEGVALNEMVFDDAGEMIDYRILDVNSAFHALADRVKDGPIIGQLASELYGMDRETIRAFWQSHRNSRTPGTHWH